MTFRSEGMQATGHRALDEHGSKVGTIVDVLFRQDGEPEWAVVDPGRFHKPHYAPLEGAYQSQDGDIILPVPSEVVRHAPTADRTHVITPELEEELNEYYR